MQTKPTLNTELDSAIKAFNKRPYLQKFSNWLTGELFKHNCTYTEAEAMFQDFSRMSEKRLKKLSINFNL